MRGILSELQSPKIPLTNFFQYFSKKNQYRSFIAGYKLQNF